MAVNPSYRRFTASEKVAFSTYNNIAYDATVRQGLGVAANEKIVGFLYLGTPSGANRGDKMGMLYDYLTSNAFKLQIEGIVEGFTRFSPTSTPEQLEALGVLWAEHPECLMQTHLSEQTDEIALVRKLFPNARDYLDTYETFGLLGGRGLYGHAIHLEPREMDRLAEVGASVVHCPTSNTFIGSGLFNTAGMMAHGIKAGLATDTGGGSSFSMLRTMAAAYEIAQLRGVALHPAQLLWLATCGSARALHLDHQIGNIAPGMVADMVVLDLASTPAIAQRSARAEDIWEEIFPTIMMGDDRAIAATYVAGQRV